MFPTLIHCNTETLNGKESAYKGAYFDKQKVSG